MALTTFEKGVLQGRQEGQRMILRKQLKGRFGPLSPAAQEGLEGLGDERLDELALSVVKARSLKELGLED